MKEHRQCCLRLVRTSI